MPFFVIPLSVLSFYLYICSEKGDVLLMKTGIIDRKDSQELQTHYCAEVLALLLLCGQA